MDFAGPHHCVVCGFVHAYPDLRLWDVVHRVWTHRAAAAVRTSRKGVHLGAGPELPDVGNAAQCNGERTVGGADCDLQVSIVRRLRLEFNAKHVD